MPHPDRILKTYVLNNTKRRGALWSFWLTPEETGNNNIYFSNNGYLDPDKEMRGHSLHLSLHKNGKSHVRHEKGVRIHDFQRARDDVFPICSVFTPLSDLAEIKTPLSKLQNLNSVLVKEFNVDDELNWSELAFLHASDAWIQNWEYSSKDFGFELVEDIDIKQNRKIIVLHRYIRKPSLSNFQEVPKRDNPSPNSRITYWAVKEGEDNYVVIYDFSSERLKDGAFNGI